MEATEHDAGREMWSAAYDMRLAAIGLAAVVRDRNPSDPALEDFENALTRLREADRVYFRAWMGLPTFEIGAKVRDKNGAHGGTVGVITRADEMHGAHVEYPDGTVTLVPIQDLEVVR